jgi:multicomponent Na+:H+ antiporter subunit E
MEPSSSELQPTRGHYFLIYAIVTFFWFLLVGSLKKDEVIVGLVVGAIITILMIPRLTILAGVRLSPSAPLALLRYLIIFIGALVQSNVDMARRVLSPSLPIRPGLVEIRTELESPIGKLLLANSITLTPGTLTVDVVDERIMVHWIDCPPGGSVEDRTCAIAESFERHLRGFVK